MPSDWHYSHNGEQFGPVSSDALRSLAASGHLLPTDHVWKPGLSEWIAAAKIRGLFAPPSTPGKPASVIAPPPSRPGPSPRSLPSDFSQVRMCSSSALATDHLGNSESWKDVIATRKCDVVLIEHSEGLGSGLLVGESGLIVTNRHVVEGAKVLQVQFSNGTSTHGAILDLHQSSDLAIIKAAAQSTHYFDVSASCAATVQAGDEVVAIGHPHGLRFTSTRGIISVVKQRIDKEYFLQHDVAINPGNSGGPLFGRDGRLVGLNTFVRKNAQGLGFAIPALAVRDYVVETVRRIASGALAVPSDEEICESASALSPEEALTAAVMAFDGERKPLKNGHGFFLASQGGRSCAVWIANDMLICMLHIADLDDAVVEDANLLTQLLKINHSIGQAKFSLSDDLELWIVAARSTAGLDAVEAYSVVAAVLSAADHYEDGVLKYLREVHELEIDE